MKKQRRLTLKEWVIIQTLLKKKLNIISLLDSVERVQQLVEKSINGYRKSKIITMLNFLIGLLKKAT